MAQTYTIQQGDHLSSVAAKLGFADYRTIWDHPKNADLKKKRQNPNVLFPGDTVYIPDKQVKKEQCATGRLHRFLTRVEKLKLRLTLKGVDGRPIANTPCELTVDGGLYKLTSDADGHIDAEVPRAAESGEMRLLDTIVPVKIGHLDPVDQTTGALARLANLGYYRGSQAPVDEAELLSAIEEFQCDNDLTVNGQCDGATLAKLKEAHGC